MTDLILLRAIRVTAREERTEEFWFRALSAGFFAEAKKIQRTGYDAEHYMAALSEVPDQVTEEQNKTLARLEAEAEAAIKDFNDKLRRRNEQPPEPRERPHSR